MEKVEMHVMKCKSGGKFSLAICAKSFSFVFVCFLFFIISLTRVLNKFKGE